MKTAKILYKNLTNKLVSLKIFKTFSYNFKHYLIKKLLIILYKFHTNNKKILFFGLSSRVFEFLEIFKLKTKHVFIKNNYWLNGSFSNYMAIKYFFLINKKFKKFFDIKTKTSFNLFVSFSYINKEIIKTGSIVLNFNKSSKFLELKFSVPIISQTFFQYLLVYIILKRL